MSFLTFGLAQKLTYWELIGVDGYNQPQFAAPVQRVCRWEERSSRLENAVGQVVLSRARIFLAEDMKLGDYVAIGVVTGADPRSNPQAREVLEFRKLPSLDASAFERKIYI